MKDDLVERLRYCHEHGVFDAARALRQATYGEAADRIEALIAAGDRLADVFWHNSECAVYYRTPKPCNCGLDDALKAWHKETGHE